MTKSAMSVGLLLAVAGCGSTSSGTVKVYLFPDGHLAAYSMNVSPSEIPAFAKEVGSRRVQIVPNNTDSKTVTFTQAADVRDALKAAGVRDVTIAIAGE